MAALTARQASHAGQSLRHATPKYADVVKSDEVIAFLKSLPKQMFELPGGRLRPA